MPTPAGSEKSAPNCDGPGRALCARMSQFAAVIACQRPLKLGWPAMRPPPPVGFCAATADRGGVWPLIGMAVAATRTATIRNRPMGLLMAPLDNSIADTRQLMRHCYHEGRQLARRTR